MAGSSTCRVLRHSWMNLNRCKAFSRLCLSSSFWINVDKLKPHYILYMQHNNIVVCIFPICKTWYTDFTWTYFVLGQSLFLSLKVWSCVVLVLIFEGQVLVLVFRGSVLVNTTDLRFEDKLAHCFHYSAWRLPDQYQSKFWQLNNLTWLSAPISGSDMI